MSDCQPAAPASLTIGSVMTMQPTHTRAPPLRPSPCSTLLSNVGPPGAGGALDDSSSDYYFPGLPFRSGAAAKLTEVKLALAHGNSGSCASGVPACTFSLALHSSTGTGSQQAEQRAARGGGCIVQPSFIPFFQTNPLTLSGSPLYFPSAGTALHTQTYSGYTLASTPTVYSFSISGAGCVGQARLLPAVGASVVRLAFAIPGTVGSLLQRPSLASPHRICSWSLEAETDCEPSHACALVHCRLAWPGRSAVAVPWARQRSTVVSHLRVQIYSFSRAALFKRCVPVRNSSVRPARTHVIVWQC